MNALAFATAMMCVSLLACGSRHTKQPETLVRGDGFSLRIRRELEPTSAVFRTSADEVWKVLPATFGGLGFPAGKSVTPAERFFSTQEMTVTAQLYQGEPNSLYFDCGQTPAGGRAADEYLLMFTILARVVPDDEKLSHVEIAVDGRAHDRTRSNATAKFCRGTGLLEQMVIDALRRRLGA
jgi:hypothetical protein